MPSTFEDILAYRAESSVEARALAAHLANAGILAQVVGDFLEGAYGGIQAGTLLGSEVWVPAADREAAEELIAAWDAEHHADRVLAAATAPEAFSWRTAVLAATGLALLGMLVIRLDVDVLTFAIAPLALLLLTWRVLLLCR